MSDTTQLLLQTACIFYIGRQASWALFYLVTWIREELG